MRCMTRRVAHGTLATLLLLALPCVAAQDADRFARRYGHGATALEDDPVWIVERRQETWQVRLAANGEVADAHRLNAKGRAGFWDRMTWPAATASEADCLTWGEKPASLADFLDDSPPSPAPAGDDYGNAVLCHVPAAHRAQIDWLSTHGSDWFYYDPMFGVMEVHPLP